MIEGFMLRALLAGFGIALSPDRLEHHGGRVHRFPLEISIGMRRFLPIQ